MSMVADVDTSQIVAIATEVFAAMLDRETGHLSEGSSVLMTLSDPLYAWVELSTVPASRVQLTTDVDTAGDLTHAFLSMDEAEPVVGADVMDAFGEIANVFGGSIKALLPEHVQLTLPQVSRRSPSGSAAVRLNEALLAWHGRLLVISLWTI